MKIYVSTERQASVSKVPMLMRRRRGAIYRQVSIFVSESIGRLQGPVLADACMANN